MVSHRHSSVILRPPIASLLDLDFYKLTMLQFVWKNFSSAQVRFAFVNRTKGICVADFVRKEDLLDAFEYVRQIKFTRIEIEFLRQQGVFDEDFLYFLKSYRLPEVTVGTKSGEYHIEVSGLWVDVSLWETIVLSIVNELYHKAVTASFDHEWRNICQIGDRKLAGKIRILKGRPDIKFLEFGTRRRYSREWQEHVLKVLAKEFCDANLIGTSNVHLAFQHNLKPVGTFAHELFMGAFGVFMRQFEEIDQDPEETVRMSHRAVLNMWRQMYGDKLQVALSDTYGSDYFLRDWEDNPAGQNHAHTWSGLRHDSGCPFKFADQVVAFYERLDIDPMSKMIVFSDGLNIDKIVRLADYCAGRINCGFGWGTNLTNDLGYKTLSLVMKLVEAEGCGTVKLSDNIAKAMGPQKNVDLVKRAVGYSNTSEEELEY